MKKIILFVLTASLLLSACGDGKRQYRIVFTDGTEKIVSHFMCVSKETRVECNDDRADLVPNSAYYDVRWFEEVR